MTVSLDLFGDSDEDVIDISTDEKDKSDDDVIFVGESKR